MQRPHVDVRRVCVLVNNIPGLYAVQQHGALDTLAMARLLQRQEILWIHIIIWQGGVGPHIITTQQHPTMAASTAPSGALVFPRNLSQIRYIASTAGPVNTGAPPGFELARFHTGLTHKSSTRRHQGKLVGPCCTHRDCCMSSTQKGMSASVHTCCHSS